MSRQSALYPDRPWPVASLVTHPAFALMMRDAKKSDAFYELQRVALNPDRYRDGIGWYDFVEECASSQSAETAAALLARMQVLRLDTSDPDNPRLVACEKTAAEIAVKSGRQNASFYLQSSLLSAAKAEAAGRHVSMSRLVEAAIAAYLGLDTAS